MEDQVLRDDLPDIEEMEQGRRVRIKWGLTILNLAVVLFLLVSSALLFLSAQGSKSVILGARMLLMEGEKGVDLIMVRPEDRNLDSKDKFLYSSLDGKLAICEIVGVTDEIIQFIPNGEEIALSINKDDPGYGGKLVMQSGFLGNLSAPVAERADAIVLYLLIAGVLLLVLLLLVLVYVIIQKRKTAEMLDSDEDEIYIEYEEDEEEDELASSAPFPLDRVIIIPGKDGSSDTVRLPEYVLSKLTEPPLPKELDEIIAQYSTPPSSPVGIGLLLNRDDAAELPERSPAMRPRVEQAPPSEKPAATPMATKPAYPRAANIGTKPLSDLNVSNAAAARIEAQKPTRPLAHIGQALSETTDGVKKPSAHSSSLRAPVSLSPIKPKSAAEKAMKAYVAPPTPEEAARLLDKELHEAREVLAEEEEKKEIIPPPESRPFFSLTKPIPFEEFLPQEPTNTKVKVEADNQNSDIEDSASELDSERLAAIMDSLYTGDAKDRGKKEEPESPLGKLLSSKTRKEPSASQKASPELFDDTAEPERLADKEPEMSFSALLEKSSRAKAASSRVVEEAEKKPLTSITRRSRVAVAPEPLDAIPEPEPVAPEPIAPEPVAPEPIAPEPIAPEPITPKLPSKPEAVQRTTPTKERARPMPKEPTREVEPIQVAQEVDELAELKARRERRRMAAPTPQTQASKPASRHAVESADSQEQAPARSRSERLSRLERNSRSERTEASPLETTLSKSSGDGRAQASTPVEDAAASADLLARLPKTSRTKRAGQSVNPVFDVRDDVPEDFVAELPGPARRSAEARREREATLLRPPPAQRSERARTQPVSPPSTVPGSEDSEIDQLIRDLWDKSEP